MFRSNRKLVSLLFPCNFGKSVWLRPSSTWTSSAAAATTSTRLFGACSFSTSNLWASTNEHAKALVGGNRLALSRAITMTESTLQSHREQAQEILDFSLEMRAEITKKPLFMQSFRIGISGSPGVGKSSFIETFGLFLIEQGHKVAVIAVDPSSVRTKGSILGDKTRMMQLSCNDNAFVRPSPTNGTLGGIAQHTDEVIMMCEAAGYDVVIIETVGVGQSEIAVQDVSDMCFVMVPPAGGDSLQGMKRGIMEMADLIVVNKADGNLIQAAKLAQAEYRNGLDYIQPKHPSWKPMVLTCSAHTKDGISTVWEKAQSFWTTMTQNGALLNRRKEQRSKWAWFQAEASLCEKFRNDPQVLATASKLEHEMGFGYKSPASVAVKLVASFLKN